MQFHFYSSAVGNMVPDCSVRQVQACSANQCHILFQDCEAKSPVMLIYQYFSSSTQPLPVVPVFPMKFEIPVGGFTPGWKPLLCIIRCIVLYVRSAVHYFKKFSATGYSVYSGFSLPVSRWRRRLAIGNSGTCAAAARYNYRAAIVSSRTWLGVGPAIMASSSSSSSAAAASSRVGHHPQQQLQRASSAPVSPAEASTSNSAKSNVKLSVTNKALTTSAKR